MVIYGYFTEKKLDILAKELFEVVTGKDPEEFVDSTKDIEKYLKENGIRQTILRMV